MKKIFNEILDINGKSQKYPIAEDGVVFFFTQDRKFCIYALYTRKDFTESNLIELSQDAYDAAFAAYVSAHGHEPVCIMLNSMEAIKGVTSFVKYKAAVDNTALEDLYNLNYKGE